MDQKTFLKNFGSVVEDSPWVTEAVFETGVDSLTGSGDADTLSERFKSVFMQASPERQLATLQAHPQLACALVEEDKLSPDSASEQVGVGLDQCSTAEFAEFARLNAAYLEKFGFPFIIAVKGRDRYKILNLFRMRLKNDAVLEYQTALLQVCEIARLRIEGVLNA